MKRILISIFIFSNCLNLLSQVEILNWIIFLDGKIPLPIVLNGSITCFENTPQEKIINFEYSIGNIKILKDDINYIKENGEAIKSLNMKLYYKAFEKKDHNIYIYSFNIPPKLLLPIYDYIVLRITNINKKKRTFYFAYSTDYESVVWLNTEPRIFHDIYVKNTKRKLTKSFDSKEIKMKQIIINP